MVLDWNACRVRQACQLSMVELLDSLNVRVLDREGERTEILQGGGTRPNMQ